MADLLELFRESVKQGFKESNDFARKLSEEQCEELYHACLGDEELKHHLVKPIWFDGKIKRVRPFIRRIIEKETGI